MQKHTILLFSLVFLLLSSCAQKSDYETIKSNKNCKFCMLRSQSLMRQDFSHKNYTGLYAIYSDFQASNFTDSVLKGSGFYGSNLLNTNFSRTNIDHMTMIGCQAKGIILDEAFGSLIDFRDSNMMYASLKKVKFSEVSFARAQLNKAVFEDALLQEANFQEANLRSTVFQNAFLNKANFLNSQLQNANFIAAQLSGANFYQADLGGSDFTNADLSYADLRGANLNNVNFTNTNLEGTKLCGATLPGGNAVDFCSAQLIGVEDQYKVSYNKGNYNV